LGKPVNQSVVIAIFKQQFTSAAFSLTVDWPRQLVSLLRTPLVSALLHCLGSRVQPTVLQVLHPTSITYHASPIMQTEQIEIQAKW